MELMDLLQSRRAFREYDDQPLTSEELQPILLAAETSPVGLGKYRNHRLTVIQDPKVLNQIQLKLGHSSHDFNRGRNAPFISAVRRYFLLKGGLPALLLVVLWLAI